MAATNSNWNSVTVNYSDRWPMAGAEVQNMSPGKKEDTNACDRNGQKFEYETQSNQ